MCPRLVWAKIRPGDLVWNLMDEGEDLYFDDEAGANREKREVATRVEGKQACLCIAVDNDRLMVLAPNGSFGWTFRHAWQRAGQEKQEWEHVSAWHEDMDIVERQT